LTSQQVDQSGTSVTTMWQRIVCLPSYQSTGISQKVNSSHDKLTVKYYG